MPNIRTMMGSKFLKQEDVPGPMLVTVSMLEQQEINAGEGAKETKWVMHFTQLDKPLVMNPTNLQLAALALGSEETETWVGQTLVLYRDPTVSMGGKVVGGLRLRARKLPPAPVAVQTPPAPKPAPQPTAAGRFDDMEDDIPF